MARIDPAHLDQTGWAVVPGLVSAAEAARLAQACGAVLASEGHRAGDKPHGGTRRAAALLDRLPEVRSLFAHPDLMAVVEQLLGPGVPVADVAFRSPQPGFGQQSLHADDSPTTRAGECRAVTAIVALCDFTEENGATVVVPGSHRRPDLQRRAATLGPSAPEVVLAGPAGTAFVFSAHLLHRGARNRSARPRPALQAQWRR